MPSSQKCIRVQTRSMVLPVERPRPQPPAPTLTVSPGVQRPTPALRQPQFRVTPPPPLSQGRDEATVLLVRQTLGHRGTWAARGKGKRGGSRVIYYWAVSADQLLLLLIYSKSERDDLTPQQLRTLKRIVEEEYP